MLHYEYIKKVKYKQNRMEIYGINQTKIGTNEKILVVFFCKVTYNKNINRKGKKNK